LRCCVNAFTTMGRSSRLRNIGPSKNFNTTRKSSCLSLAASVATRSVQLRCPLMLL
jgi:hypothetical protein